MRKKNSLAILAMFFVCSCANEEMLRSTSELNSEPELNSNSQLSSAAVVTLPAYAVEGYYISWGTYRRGFDVMNIPANKLTQLYYAFSNTDNTKCILGDEFADINKAFDGDSSAPTALRG